MIYCLRLPNGTLTEETVSTSNSECWAKSFEVLCNTVPRFRERYWKKWDRSRRAALRLGYRVVPCELGVAEMAAKQVVGLRHALFMLLQAAEREISTRLCNESSLRAMNEARRQLRLTERRTKVKGRASA